MIADEGARPRARGCRPPGPGRARRGGRAGHRRPRAGADGRAEGFADRFAGALDEALASAPRRPARAEQDRRRGGHGKGWMLLARDRAEAVAAAERFAPEHLELLVASRGAGRPRSEARGPYSWAPARPRSSGTTAPARTTACRPEARRASRLGYPSSLSCARGPGSRWTPRPRPGRRASRGEAAALARVEGLGGPCPRRGNALD